MNTAFVCSTNFHFCFGRQECFHINSYLKCVGCLVIQGLQSNFEIGVGGGHISDSILGGGTRHL